MCGSKADLPVPFLRASNEITDRLAGEGRGPAHSSVEYADAITERLKRRLKEVGVWGRTRGDEAANRGGIFWV